MQKKKKKNSKYQQESEDEIISTSKTKLNLYENSSHMSKSQKKLKKKHQVVINNILNNIESNEKLPLSPFEQNINSANNSLMHDVADSKKKKTASVINSNPAKTMPNKTSLVNDPNTINSEGIYQILYLPTL